jgi:GntR family transcriptional regulator/MocR family aminotransferase
MIPTILNNGKPLYEQVYEFYKESILLKRMKFNQRLPSYRQLAKELGVSNNTVLRAYEQLILEGYVRNEDRKGLFVTKIDTTEWAVKSSMKSENDVGGGTPAKKGKRRFSPSVHMVDEEHFPLAHWRKCGNRALDSMSFQYEEYEGEDSLKIQLCDYLYHYRGVHATPDRLIIGSGASVLLFWLAFVLKNTCSRVVVEEPGYGRPKMVFSELGYNVLPVRVRELGVDVSELLKKKADLVYLTPSHQYPTGTAIPVSHRIQILNWARKNNVYIIEDDFDCEFRYKTKLMPSLQGLDQNNRVIYMGSFSNSLMPSLRVAYLVLPEHFSVPYQHLVFLTNTVPYFVRKTLAIFMEEGFWERHLKKMRNLYKRKYDLCIRALSQIPRSLVHFNRTPSGLNILLRIHTKLSEEELIKRAYDKGIIVTQVSAFYSEKKNRPVEPEVLFEFGSLPEDEIEKLIANLFRTWFPKVSGL